MQKDGQLAKAKVLWESLLFDQDMNNGSEYDARHDPAPYYFLAEVYLEEGEGSALSKLYELARERRINPNLVQWIAAQFSGNWVEGVFSPEKIISLAGDLKDRENELKPYLVQAKPFSLELDNRNVQYASPPAFKRIDFSANALNFNGRLMVDVLQIAEIFDVFLGYHPGSNVITFEGRARPIKLGLGDNGYGTSSTTGRHNSAVLRYDGRIYVPLRLMLEHYGYHVNWQAATNTVLAY